MLIILFYFIFIIRESQFRRKQEYEKELEEIRQRVSEQNLLLERHSKVFYFLFLFLISVTDFLLY